MGKYNDLDLRTWKRYGDIETDSLWIIKERDTSNGHHGGFHGNFVPQIPNQFLRRYTKTGEWVLDPFLGGGTTLIEARRLGRNAVGFEINPATAKLAQENIANAAKYGKSSARVVVENVDSVSANYREILKKHGVDAVQFAILHPPYADIIKFGEEPNNLSNFKDAGFVGAFCKVLKNVREVLAPGRFMCIVIGDKYHRGEWIPLGFWCMEAAQVCGFKLKSILVKNFDETKGKANQRALWRYRALSGGFYVFKHEYIFLFQN